MKVMDQLHNTKVTTIECSKTFPEGGPIEDKQPDGGKKFNSYMMVTAVKSRKQTQVQPQLVLSFVSVVGKVNLDVVLVACFSNRKSISIPLMYYSII